MMPWCFWAVPPLPRILLFGQWGEYRLLTLPRRIHNRPLPEVEIVDMRWEPKAKNRSMFSRRLQQEIALALQQKEQVILFLNQGGTPRLCTLSGMWTMSFIANSARWL